MRIDIHNHTERCNHAEGSIDDFVRRAIELGIDIYGFSEHAPMDFDPQYRLKFEEMASYTTDVLDAKRRYAGSIEIIVGYEVDWLPGHMDERVLNADVDYLIGSVHFLDSWGFDNPEFLSGWKDRDTDEVWEAYFEAVADMARSGLFDIVGHLDLIKVFRYLPRRDIPSIAKGALEAIADAGMVMEINSAGLRKPAGEIYPSAELLAEARRLDIPITFGSDAHRVSDVGAGYAEALRAAKEAGYDKAVTFEKREKKLLTF